MPKQNNASTNPISNDPRDILGQPNIYKNITQPIRRNIQQQAAPPQGAKPELKKVG